MSPLPRLISSLVSRFASCLAAPFALLLLVSFPVASAEQWTGNMLRNPGFEEDFVNANAEGHVLSFKGDWYYNQQDLIPDYWALKGDWTWTAQRPHGGTHALKLEEGGTATQSFVRAAYQEGGSAWGGGTNKPILVAEEELARFNQPWRVTVWCRGGGSVALACGKQSVKSEPAAGNAWQQITLELPVEATSAANTSCSVTLVGPGEFDDATISERLTDAPNLVWNAGFETLDKQGYPVGWSQQQKFRAIGPTYYVWTDWNHYFRANRGPVSVDPLVSHSGKQSLKFDVYPGDEKLVESDLIAVKQDKPRVIEVGAWVRADRIKLIDIRCVDQDGVYMPGYRPRQPEYNQGGSFLFGNGTFGWRYVRKFFATPEEKPLAAFRVRLCARGMNGHTLDDAGARSYAMQVGTVWWDDVHVCERTTDGAALRKRGVKLPAAGANPSAPLADAEIDLGERRFGQNRLVYRGTPAAGAGKLQLRLTTTLPGAEPKVTSSAAVAITPGKELVLAAPYTLDRPVGDLDKQGAFLVELLREGEPIAKASYAFNTWPVVVDFDVSRHYNLPEENPVTVSMNLGVAAATLARVKSLELSLVRPADGKVLSKRLLGDPRTLLAAAPAKLPADRKESYEFNLPTPAWWVDRTNLLIEQVDLGPLKVWPHNEPTRDTVLVLRGLDGAGRELFVDQSDPFCRMQAPPQQPAIKTVTIRDDGAVVINGQPKFLTAATHQHNRLSHTLPIIDQLGLMGHRLTQGMTLAQHQEMWQDHHLYSLQMKPGDKIRGTAPIVELTPEQRTAFEAFVRAGGMQNVISINTGGWEATINFDDPAIVKKHTASNEYLRKLTGRPLAISTSGAYNAWWLDKLTMYDINHAETEMWGPMDFNVIFTPYMKRAGRTTAWVYLPQLYDNHPYERYRFETYENIIRGSAGVSMIQGIGDPTFNRGLAGELRYLEGPLYSQEPAPAVTLEPRISHKVTRHKGKTYLLATNAGPIRLGNWRWNTEIKQSGAASHDGESINTQWFRPGGVRIHGLRGMPLPELIQAGDKLVQYVWIDPADTPTWAMLAVRGDGRFAHNGVLGKFNFNTFRENYGNVLMFSELNHSVWHDINWVMDDATHQRAVRVMGKEWADRIKTGADSGRAKVDKAIYQAEHFQSLGPLPKPGEWQRLEIDAEKFGLVGKLVDGFAWLTQDGRALWDHTVLERDGEVVRVFCEDTVGIDRAELAAVRVSVPGLKAGTKIRVLFEERTIVADEGGFVDDFTGTDTYGYEDGGVSGDLFGFVKDPDRELARLMPSGAGYNYGPTALHIYEISD